MIDKEKTIELAKNVELFINGMIEEYPPTDILTIFMTYGVLGLKEFNLSDKEVLDIVNGILITRNNI